MNVLYFKQRSKKFKKRNRLLNKGINRLRKEINRLLSKGMSNIYLKITIWEKTDILKTSIF